MNYSVAMTETVNEKLCKHLLREDGQEDLCFAFYKLSNGQNRTSALINEVLFPKDGDRNVHRNVSFNSNYFDKATSYALKHNLGICFIHSHPAPGWQGMSIDDVNAEQGLAPPVKAVTGMPLIGMTLGNDNYWSARFWIKEAPKTYSRYWCESVRVVGKSIKPYFNDRLIPKVEFGDEFKRTISSWGEGKQDDISRLKIGVVGLGSVGSIVSESLLRTGIKNITLIDFDLIEAKNLDRLLAAKRSDIGNYKVFFQRDRLIATELMSNMSIKALQYSIAESEGLKAALDCDVIFSCVDMPMPRFILDCISYANLIPVIDGGIDTNPKNDLSNIDQARWKAHTIGPERICMQCLGQYAPEDVALEQSGELEDPNYIKGLPKDHFINRGENVFGFSLSLAGMEIQQLLSLVLKPRGIYYGPKEMDFNTGNIDCDFDNTCDSNCGIVKLTGFGNEFNSKLCMEHPAAIKSRAKYLALNKKGKRVSLINRILKYFNLFNTSL